MEAKLPDKTYYKIGEVSRLTDLKPSVIRFWESEFKELCPAKSRSGQRVFTRSDIELLKHIKFFLYTERLTIEGARSRLAQICRKSEPVVAKQHNEESTSCLRLLREVKFELQQLYSEL